MTNFDTIQAVTDNIEAVLRVQGIKFDRKTYDDLKDIPGSSLPQGLVYYDGERPEDTFHQRPSYIEADFTVKVILSVRDPKDMMRAQQKWAHLVRGALTVNALNTGSLAASKLVSMAQVKAINTDNSRGDGFATVNFSITIRYRES